MNRSLLRFAAVVSFATLSSLPLHAAEKAADKGRAAASQPVDFNLYLPLQNRGELNMEIMALHDVSSPHYHKWLTPEEFRAKYAPSAAQVEAIRQQMAAQGLTITATGSQRFHVTGPASAVESTLQTTLRNGAFPDGHKTVMATSKPLATGALAEQKVVVTGLSGFIRMRPFAHKGRVTPQNRYGTTGAYWFTDLKQAYNWPSYKTYTGKGVTIGVLMTGDYNPADMDKYFSHEQLATPKFSTVQVNGGAPYDVNESFETHLDLQQTGGMAPNAKIILYNIPDLSDDNILAGLTKIVNDNKTDVVSMSFGGPELFYVAAMNDGVDDTDILREEDDLLAQGTMQGITFVASSGDSGAMSAMPIECFNFEPDCGASLASVQFPASSPHVVAVGGTNLVTTYTNSTDLNSVYVRESAYANPLDNDIFYGTSATGISWGSGGGDSILFGKPPYQMLSNTGNNLFRTVPDLAMHMGGCPAGSITCSDDDSSVISTIGGVNYGTIGTSASAPDFAGLTALAVQRFGTRMGNENFYIYSLALTQAIGLTPNIFHQGIPGYNGLYYTTPKGYNKVLGNGTVRGKNFLLAPLVPSAGTPMTPSNP
jgi:subtilase family serine protease